MDFLSLLVGKSVDALELDELELSFHLLLPELVIELLLHQLEVAGQALIDLLSSFSITSIRKWRNDAQTYLVAGENLDLLKGGNGGGGLDGGGLDGLLPSVRVQYANVRVEWSDIPCRTVRSSPSWSLKPRP